MVTMAPAPSGAARPARRPAASGRLTAALTAGGVVVAGAASAIVAVTAMALGAANGFAPLMPAVYLPFVAVGVIGAIIGWRIIRSRAAHPGVVLRVLIPVVLVASFIPDAVLMITRFIPGTTLTGGLSLSVMHIIVAAVAIPVAQRIAPVAR